MIVKELMMKSLVKEESELAHYLYHLLSEKIISYYDDMNDIDFNQANHQKVADMIRNNFLGFHKTSVLTEDEPKRKLFLSTQPVG